MGEQCLMERDALEAVAEGFRFNAMKLPALPEVTQKVRAIAADPESSVEELAAEILNDAALTARLIRVANSPLLRGRQEVRTLPQAITRLGFYYVRDLVTAFALEHAYVARTAAVRQLQQHIARYSRDVAAVSQVLARHCSELPPEQALVAGLLHFIGALPLLAAVDEAQIGHFEATEAMAMIERHHGEVGAALLRHWHFPEDIACVPESYQASADEEEALRLADIVAVASLLSRTLDGPVEARPDLAALPAARKLGLEDAGTFYDCEAMQIDLQKSRGLLG
jgi:HD-like signal output (HDOD) protein